MSFILFSTESEIPAAQMIMVIFEDIKKKMVLKEASTYCDSIDEIGIIPCCVTQEYWNYHKCKERKYVSWKRREADIRLYMDWERFVHSSKEARVEKCKEIIIQSIQIVRDKCYARGMRFDYDSLVSDMRL